MDDFLRHQNGSSWGFHHHLLYTFSFVSVTIYHLLGPSTSFNAPKLVVVQPKKPTPIIGSGPGEISLGARNSSWEASETFCLEVCSGALPWGLVLIKESPEKNIPPSVTRELWAYLAFFNHRKFLNMDPMCDLFPNFLDMIRCLIFSFGVFMFDF